jgi:UDP-hydrolysing UDP-N-acetyl-D-glucosamine 2-epimerase
VVVVTGSRADYGLLRPTIAALDADPRFELLLVAAAMHLSRRFGETFREIEEDGFAIAERVETEPERDEPGALGRRLGAAAGAFTDALSRLEPDVLLLLGDRYEQLAAALAAAGLGVPIAHLHGGELSEGSLDDAMRHSITKLAHLHFPAAREYGERICQLGEQPERVHVVGAAGIESIRTLELLDRGALSDALGGIELGRPLIVLTLHPASLEPESAAAHAAEVMAAVEELLADGGTVVVTLPNDDPGNEPVRAAALELAGRRDDVHAFESLGQLRYLSLLSQADVMVGNSSSGLLEAPSFALPAVNVGERQRGRIIGPNVVPAAPERGAVVAAARRALEAEFRDRIRGAESPYGTGQVSARVLEVLATTPLGPELRHKRFLDLPEGEWRAGLALGEPDR